MQPLTMKHPDVVVNTDRQQSFISSIQIQRFLLQIFGFGSGQTKRITDKLLYTVGILLVTGGWISVVFNSGVAISTIIQPDEELPITAILQAFCSIPYASINIRGVLVLSIFLGKSRLWREVLGNANEIALANIPVYDKKVIRLWRLLSIALTVVTLFLCFLWEVIDGVTYVTVSQKNLSSDGVLDPLPVDMRVWEYYTFWTFLSSLPFFLSQQVYISFIVLSKMLADSCRVLNTDITREIEELKRYNTLRKNDDPNRFVLKPVPDILASSREFKNRYISLCDQCDRMNALFGKVIFVIYVFDILTAFGFVSCLVSREAARFLISFIFSVISGVLFIAYSTVFLWPMVGVYEESLQINGLVHRFIAVVETCDFNTTKPVRALHSLLHTFLLTSRDLPLLFQGGGLFYITRTFIFTTFTLLLTFVVIAKEFGSAKL